MSDWGKEKQWSDRFLPEIKSILGVYLIGEPPIEDDKHRNTDLIVLKMEAVRIGCRVRRAKYAGRYGGEFTIRCAIPNGGRTELSKIIEGWGDYFFYGFATEDENSLSLWTLADMNVFRLWHSQQLYKSGARDLPGQRKTNHDGSSDFVAFRWGELPDDFVVAKS